jgi:hypothetical protein
VNGKILELIELDNRYTVAKEEKKAVDAKEDEARKAYQNMLKHLIDSNSVKVDQVYLIDGKAVIFRKKTRYDDHGRCHPHYDYSYEVLSVTS